MLFNGVFVAYQISNNIRLHAGQNNKKLCLYEHAHLNTNKLSVAAVRYSQTNNIDVTGSMQ